MLRITRVFDAPRSLVFRMWTDRDHLSRWLAPIGFTVIHAEGDLYGALRGRLGEGRSSERGGGGGLEKMAAGERRGEHGKRGSLPSTAGGLRSSTGMCVALAGV